MSTSVWRVSAACCLRAAAPLLTALVLMLCTTVFAQSAKVTYRPEAGSLFASCKVQPEGSIGRNYLCPGLTATIAWVEVPAEFSDQQMLGHFRSGIAAMSTGKLESKETRLTLGGIERDTLEFQIRDLGDGKKVQAAGHASLLRQEKGGWYVSCAADPARRIAVKHCERILEFFAVHGVPEPIDLKAHANPSKPVVGTTELVVPEGCTVSGPKEAGQIRCSGSFLGWVVVPHPPSMKKFREEQLVPIRKQFQDLAASKGSVLEESDVECRVMGEQGVCRQLLLPMGAGNLRSLSGVTRQGAQTILLFCVQGDLAKELPAVCRGQMELIPTAPAEEKTPPAAPK
ncbi:lipoprotein [Myxococcus stipitatus DSM 14675]|uniref:Lipoprotein n=1 Tax=Myxococcus stipitatus (strain DSM 14675 / JCM 12634 / Mx s8) TaxID=1278073 RepID=L7UD85_MYXSD|nr:hypothetical protein [Myxococcus stipitatus]AGC45835.1 lipoprotein [Myxococcus stipitatus DSM 14675]